jgi:hypothetical protein
VAHAIATTPPVITSPVNGTKVFAGQSLQISARITAGAFPSGLALLAQDPLGSAPVQKVAGSTVSFTLPIPPDAPLGPYSITVVGVSAEAVVVRSSPLSIDVEQANQASAISAYPGAITIASVGDTRCLMIFGSFPGNLQIDITNSSQLKLISANSAIATVQNGMITAVARGKTGIVVQYDSATLVIPITVP